MKFLFYTDLHLKGKNPRSRTDDFPNAVLEKLAAVYQIAARENVDAVLFGGDFCDSPTIFRYDVIVRAADIISSSHCQTYAVLGQHDIFGYNRSSYEGTTLSLIEHFCPKFAIIWEPIKFPGLTLSACHVFDDLEKKFDGSGGGFSILIAHKLLHSGKECFETIPTDSVKSSHDLILSGDLHCGFPTHTLGKTTFCNPGAMARLSIADKNRSPAVSIIQTAPRLLVVQTPIPHGYGDDVFDKSLVDEVRSQPRSSDVFFGNIEAIRAESIDVFDFVKKSAPAHGLSDRARDYLLSKRGKI